MPSSTFSFEGAPRDERGVDDLVNDVATSTRARVRTHDVDVPWRAALLVFVLLVALGEVSVRALGHRPSVVDDARLFAVARHNATAFGENAVVLIGKSRIQLGVDAATWGERLPHRPLVQLAIHGKSAFAVLASLADDDDFRGTVVFSFTEEDLTDGARDEAQALVDDAKRWASFASRTETALRSALQSHVALVNPQVSMTNVLIHVFNEQRLPTPHFTVTHRDRTQHADFARTDADALRAHYDEVRRAADRAVLRRPVNPTRWRDEAQAVIPLVEKLRGRGARVVFLKFLHCDDADLASERWYPRTQFFDVIVRDADVASIHHRDFQTWRRFPCPDSSHLDAADVPAFTDAFIDTLLQKELIDAPPAG